MIGVHDVHKSLQWLDDNWELYHEVEHGEIVVRLRVKESDYDRGHREYMGRTRDRGHEICRLGWDGHLHAPAEPLHESVVNLIGRSLVAALRGAHAAGYARAQQDIRGALGITGDVGAR